MHYICLICKLISVPGPEEWKAFVDILHNEKYISLRLHYKALACLSWGDED